MKVGVRPRMRPTSSSRSQESQVQAGNAAVPPCRCGDSAVGCGVGGVERLHRPQGPRTWRLLYPPLPCSLPSHCLPSPASRACIPTSVYICGTVALCSWSQRGQKMGCPQTSSQWVGVWVYSQPPLTAGVEEVENGRCGKLLAYGQA